MTRFIDDIQRIAKTKELESRIRQTGPSTDKRAIGINRGIGYATPDEAFSECKILYDANAGNYEFQEIIDGTREPGIVDGAYNSCEQLNTITDMTDCESERILYLKPDGLQLDLSSGGESATYLYTSHVIIQDFIGNYMLQNDPQSAPYLTYDPTLKWGFATLEEAQQATLDIITAGEMEAFPGLFDSFEWSGPSSDLIVLDESNLTNMSPPPDDYNWDVTYPLYTRPLQPHVLVGIDPDPTYYTFFGVPCNYDYDIEYDLETAWAVTPNSGKIITAPYINDSNGEAFDMFLVHDPGEVLPACTAFQLLLDSISGKWQPVEGEPYPVKYTNGVNVVDFCFGDGRFGRVRPAKDGGFALMELDSEGGSPTGFARIYRNNRTLAAIVPVNQLFGYIA